MKFKPAGKNGGMTVELNKTESIPGVLAESWLKPHPNFRIKKVVVPVDFSEPSMKALQYAIAVAKEFEAELILIHAIQPIPVVPDLPAATPELEEQLKKEATNSLTKLSEGIKDVPCRQIVCVGQPARQIVAEAKQQQADLIIVATHGRTGLAHFFLGSVAEQVVRLAACPVLVVRQEEKDFVVVGADDPELNRIGQPHAKNRVAKKTRNGMGAATYRRKQ